MSEFVRCQCNFLAVSWPALGGWLCGFCGHTVDVCGRQVLEIKGRSKDLSYAREIAAVEIKRRDGKAPKLSGRKRRS